TVLGSISEDQSAPRRAAGQPRAAARTVSEAAPTRIIQPQPAAAPKAAPERAAAGPALRPAQLHKTDMPPAPAAPQLMEEKGIDAAAVQGTGRRGQVLKEDVEAAAARPPEPPAAPAPPPPAAKPAPPPAAEAVAYAPMTTPPVPAAQVRA